MNTFADLGLLRVAVVTPEVRVADVRFNLARTVDALRAAAAEGASLAAFPEMGLTSYTCGDLFYQFLLLDEARDALLEITPHTEVLKIAALIGLPLRIDGRLFNCAALLANGRVLGVVPKTYLPNYSEFYDERWYSSSRHATTSMIMLNGEAVPFGIDLLFRARNVSDCVIGVEICEDLWAVIPPSNAQAVAGATVLLNPSASTEVLGKSGYRRELVGNQSARCIAAYLYAGSGPGESTMDVVYGGHSIIAENGLLLAETERFKLSTQMAVADLDLQRLAHERLNNQTFGDEGAPSRYREVLFDLHPNAPAHPMRRPLSATPFVPADPAQRARNCNEIFNIQATGLAKRLKHTGGKKATIGISGGLDSTLALLVTCRAFDMLELDRKGINAITMPGFGTTSRTYENALGLMANLGVTSREISIKAAVQQHFKDIGHNESQHDVTYENAQARERTQILMDSANMTGGFVVGTGDLSEAALGWMTFNGDHMSMYHVNAGVPKTLVKYLIGWAADSEFTGETSDILHDIIDTPITPELLPLGADGQLQQQTEDTVGPYVLHDFFLFYVVRYGFTPRKVFFLAQQAFGGTFNDAAVLKWLRVFYTRFFSQQFKRSSMPDGPKVGSVALSPRGDWRMPSDAVSALWLEELARVEREVTAAA
jgi:NAD+ synthase (glutamine-hydrolysing)